MSNSTPVETEVKLRLPDAKSGRALLRSAGAEKVRDRHFEDNWLFDDAARSLTAQGKVLRVRRTDTGAVLTYKGLQRVEEGIKAREEVEQPLADADAFRLILTEIGFKPLRRYQKYREIYRWGGLEIVLDETPIGVFLELEGAIAEIHTCAAELGFSREDYISESYMGIFRAAGHQGHMVFPEGA
jgi:adenylate cyclase class 2